MKRMRFILHSRDDVVIDDSEIMNYFLNSIKQIGRGKFDMKFTVCAQWSFNENAIFAIFILFSLFFPPFLSYPDVCCCSFWFISLHFHFNICCNQCATTTWTCHWYDMHRNQGHLSNMTICMWNHNYDVNAQQIFFFLVFILLSFIIRKS